MKKICSMVLCLFMIISMLFSSCSEKDSKRDPAKLSFPNLEDYMERIPFPETVPSEPEGTKPEPTEADESQPTATESPETAPVITEPEPTIPEITESEATTAPSPNETDIQSFIDGIMQKYCAVGIQVAIVDNGRIAGSYGSGWATMDSDPMTPDHKLRVASLSKIITGIIAMQMQESGIITTDSEIGPIWGVDARSYNYPDIPITIDTILTHTSTISDPGNQADMDYETVLDRLPNSFTGAKPGTILNYYYNNYAFRLLGMTLELAAGQTLDQYLYSGLFADLNIDAAFASGDISDLSKLATLYWEGNSVARSLNFQMDIHGPTFPGGDGFHYSGGLTISANDLAKILCMLVNDGYYDGQQLLRPDSVTFMESYIPYQMYDGTYQARPMVYAPSIYSRDGIYFHTGSGWGVYNCFSYDPITGDGVIVLTNGASSGGTNRYGIYYICSEINDYVYNLIQ